jgi:hypothetical protein
MNRRLAFLLVLAACKEDEPTPPHRAVEPAAALDAAAPGDARVIDAVLADAAVDALSGHAERAQRLAAYLELLSIDRWTFELLATFPGVPAGTQFFSLDYSQWDGAMWMTLDTLRDHVAKIRQAADRLPRMEVDDAVRAYLEVQDRWLGKVLDLYAYYRDSRFVDDEFDRARREVAGIAAARSELTAVRAALWRRVLEAWRELSGDVPDSPRAIVGRAWEACFRVQEVLMTEPYKADHVLVAVSACRRSIPTVTALPPALRGNFDDLLRSNAIALGDNLSARLGGQRVTSGLATLTIEYLALWPTLSTVPAERAAR